MSNVAEVFIQPLSKLFDKPDARDPVAFFDALKEDLNQFDDDTLGEAVRSIRRTRKYKTFPSIGECVAACRVVLETRPSAPKRDYFAEPRLMDDEAYRDACRMCRCEMGERADEGGWLPALLNYVRSTRRFPSEREIASLQATAPRAQASIESVADDALKTKDGRLHGSGLSTALVVFRQSMVARAHRDVFGSPDKLAQTGRAPLPGKPLFVPPAYGSAPTMFSPALRKSLHLPDGDAT